MWPSSAAATPGSPPRGRSRGGAWTSRCSSATRSGGARAAGTAGSCCRASSRTWRRSRGRWAWPKRGGCSSSRWTRCTVSRRSWPRRASSAGTPAAARSSSRPVPAIWPGSRAAGDSSGSSSGTRPGCWAPPTCGWRSARSGITAAWWTRSPGRCSRRRWSTVWPPRRSGRGRGCARGWTCGTSRVGAVASRWRPRTPLSRRARCSWRRTATPARPCPRCAAGSYRSGATSSPPPRSTRRSRGRSFRVDGC